MQRRYWLQNRSQNEDKDQWKGVLERNILSMCIFTRLTLDQGPKQVMVPPKNDFKNLWSENYKISEIAGKEFRFLADFKSQKSKSPAEPIFCVFYKDIAKKPEACASTEQKFRMREKRQLVSEKRETVVAELRKPGRILYMGP